MKVALELQPCCGNRSGVGMYVHELAKRMTDEDGLYFCGDLFNFWGRNDNSEMLKDIRMPIREAKFLPYSIYQRIRNFASIDHQSLFPGYVDLSIFFNYIVPSRVTGRVITTVYDMTYLRHPETMDQRNLARISGGIQRSVADSDHIITISEFSKREICTLLNVPEEKISVVPSAPAQFGQCADWEQTAERFHITRPYILFVGTIEPRKNLVRLIRAFDMLKQKEHVPHQLVLAGGEGWQNEEIYRAAADAAEGRDILFTGYLAQEEKNALYQNADVFVFPSLYEGFGMPPLEAMHWNCPVVCADVASLPEVAGDAACLVNPMDEESIAEGIRQVLSDKLFAQKLVERGHRQKELFTWDISARRLKETCKEVLGNL